MPKSIYPPQTENTAQSPMMKECSQFRLLPWASTPSLLKGGERGNWRFKVGTGGKLIDPAFTSLSTRNVYRSCSWPTESTPDACVDRTVLPCSGHSPPGLISGGDPGPAQKRAMRSDQHNNADWS